MAPALHGTTSFRAYQKCGKIHTNSGGDNEPRAIRMYRLFQCLCHDKCCMVWYQEGAVSPALSVDSDPDPTFQLLFHLSE